MRELTHAPYRTREVPDMEYVDQRRAYHALIGLMLSSNTKGTVSGATTRYLIDNHNLSVNTILNTPEATLAQWISNIPFYNRKAKFIK